MASREFDSSYINELSIMALSGLENHIENTWLEECERIRNYHLKDAEKKNKRWWRKLFNMAPVTVLPLKEFAEDRKTWEDDWGWSPWRNHKWDFRNTKKYFVQVAELSTENANAGRMTLLNDDEFSKLLKYSKVTPL